VSDCVFLGPSLAMREARQRLDAIYLPPVRQGDVYRAVRRWQPRIIGIVDGYFQQVPSIWHKEILWAMKHGVHVIGAASMGALRAAELESFGMIGVGKIFDAYRCGRLAPYDAAFEDDDEVAVIHGPPEVGYLAASEAMVNIRMTLAKAHAEGILTREARDTLVDLAKQRHYPLRSFKLLLERGAGLNVPDDEVEALARWLPTGKIDQKAEDAVAMLARIGELRADDPAPLRVGYEFEVTEIWADATREIDIAGAESSTSLAPDVIDELRLQGDAYLEARSHGLERMSMLAGAAGRDAVSDSAALRSASDRLRQSQGLYDRADIDAWLAANDLSLEEYDRLIEAEAHIHRHKAELDGALVPYVMDHLRVRANYGRLADRARRKSAFLATGAMTDDASTPTSETRAELVAWYFQQRLGGAIPADLDAYATRQGYSGVGDLVRALVLEFAYVNRAEQGNAD
jgi:hypothetical protein